MVLLAWMRKYWKFLIVTIVIVLTIAGIWSYLSPYYYQQKNIEYFYSGAADRKPSLERNILMSITNQSGVTASVITEDHHETVGDLAFGSLWLYISFKNSEKIMGEYLLTNYPFSETANITIDKQGNFIVTYDDFSLGATSSRAIHIIRKYSPEGVRLAF